MQNEICSSIRKCLASNDCQWEANVAAPGSLPSEKDDMQLSLFNAPRNHLRGGALGSLPFSL
jgi:hypothetical protein